MTHYRILDEAAADLEAAATWYERQRVGLGHEFIAEYRARLVSALELLGTGAQVGVTPGGAAIRRYRFKRFSHYSILLAEIDDNITVLALAHSSRRPGFWNDRLK